MHAINILIVDDHPLTCKGYSIIINNAIAAGELPKVTIDSAFSSAETLSKLKRNASKYDIVLLDILLPASEKHKIYSGEDLGIHIQNLNPKIKIIVHTGLRENHRLYNIFTNLNPEAILIKNDLDDVTLIQAINTVLTDPPFYSKTFAKLIRNQFPNQFILEHHDRELLYLLSTGVASKDIPKYIPWSSSKVEKRKRLLREKLGVEDKSVLSLVNKAKEAGFL